MSEAHKARTPRWSVILRTAVAFLAVGILLYYGRWDTDALKNAFDRLSPLAVIAATLFFMLANLVIALRWSLLLRAQHIVIALSACTKVHFLGMFYNNVLISSVGGDILRAWYITKHTHKRLEAAFSVVVDRLVGLGSLVLMALSFYVLIPVPGGAPELNLSLAPTLAAATYRYRLYIALAVIVSLAAFAGLLAYPSTRRKMLLAWASVRTQAQRVWVGLRHYATKPLSLVAAVGLTFVAQTLPILGFWLIGWSMQLPIPLKYYFVFFPIAWVVGALPITPAGLGVLEGTVIFLFTRLPDVGPADAAVLAVCQRVMFLLGSLPGLAIHVIGAHLPKAIADLKGPQEQGGPMQSQQRPL